MTKESQTKAAVTCANRQKKESACCTGVSLQAVLSAQTSIKAVLEDSGRSWSQRAKVQKKGLFMVMMVSL